MAVELREEQVAVAEEAGRIYARVVGLVRSNQIYGDVALRQSRHSGGPEIVIETDEVNPAAIFQLLEIVDGSSTGFALELHEGKLRLSSSTWAPDRIPF